MWRIKLATIPAIQRVERSVQLWRFPGEEAGRDGGAGSAAPPQGAITVSYGARSKDRGEIELAMTAAWRVPDRFATTTFRCDGK